jgi:Translation elongation factor Ts
MITLEQVEQLRAKANVSYDEAKEALEAANGDLLDAIIYLEKKGKVTPPAAGGSYSSARQSSDRPVDDKKSDAQNYENFGDLLKRFWLFCCKVVHKGNVNNFEIHKDGEYKASIPITLLVIIIIFAFWIAVPLIIIGLFFGFRYRFSGPDFKKETVNNAINIAANAAEDIKRSFKGNDH